jgi:hypothetical protein
VSPAVVAALAQRLCASEGWGFVVETERRPFYVPAFSALTGADRDRLNAIHTEMADCGLERARALSLEEDAVFRSAVLAACPREARQAYGVAVSLKPDGRFAIARGLTLKKPAQQTARVA